MFEKITQVEQTPLIRRQVVWRNHTEEMTEKQNGVKILPGPQKKKHLPYMEIGVAMTKKGKVVHRKQVWNG